MYSYIMMQSIDSSTNIAQSLTTEDHMTTHDREMYIPSRDHVIWVTYDTSGNPLKQEGGVKKRWISDMMVVKLTIIACILVCTFPIAFCDIYFALYDHTCIDQSISRMSVNMKTFLLVSGIYTYTLVGIVCGAICTTTIESTDCTCTTTLVYILSQLFITAWTVVGAILFWSLMDTSTCSSQVYIYLFTTLVIKIVCLFIQVYSDNQSVQRSK